MKHLKFFKSFLPSIKKICQTYGIQNYSINPDRSIDIDGNVNLLNKKLTKLPLKFRNVGGRFSCSYNQLTSLEGCPSSVGGDFNCSNNQLTSLEGCPSSVSGYFSCHNNQLTSLEGCPGSIAGDFNCYNNQLTSLEGCPSSVGGGFYCDGNPVYNVWVLFQDLSKVELFNDYDIIRGNELVLDRLNDFLMEIGKSEVKKVNRYKCI